MKRNLRVGLAVSALLLPQVGASVPFRCSPASALPNYASVAGETARIPRILAKLIAARWQLARVRAALPPLEQVHNEQLEFQDFVQYVFDGGALRLCVDPGTKAAVFGLLVDGSRPRYRDFAQLASSSEFAIYHSGRYVLVVPIQNVSRALIERLGARRWREAELKHLLGPPSYHWHVHGVGDYGLTFVPLGLSFVGEWGTDKSKVAYQLVTEEPGYGEAGLPPLATLRNIDGRALTRRGRDAFAQEFLSQREQIDQALATGLPSPDGRFVVSHINLGGLANTEEVVIREHDRPERRYGAPHFTDQKNYRWLNTCTVLFEVYVFDQEFYSLNARTGALALLASVPYEPSFGNPVVDFGMSNAQRFWYRTADGAQREIVVPND